jgi:hypothetical protein
MANILVRSPRFETFTMSSQGNSIKLELYIGGVLRYTIIKNSAPSSVVTFEIAELIRDYITQTFDGNYTTSTVSTASSNVKQYTGQDGTGSIKAVQLLLITLLLMDTELLWKALIQQ